MYVRKSYVDPCDWLVGQFYTFLSEPAGIYIHTYIHTVDSVYSYRPWPDDVTPRPDDVRP